MKSILLAIDDYLQLRRGLGFKLREEGRVLQDFAAFLQQRQATYITTRLAIQWATRPRNACSAHWMRRLTMVRQFALYWSAHDPRTQVWASPGFVDTQFSATMGAGRFTAWGRSDAPLARSSSWRP